jgi:hypothetical protein
MFIWIVMAIVLVVIVAGGLSGRQYQKRRKTSLNAAGSQHVTHHGKGSRNHRGRGRH